jgi:asparagine synthase (glutamine-hydrolysing)
MNDCIVHRGPDDQGLWTEGPAGLAMRRLSIIDLAHGHQPISNEDETVWIVFNGEIYNFPELRSQLEAKGHMFRTHSDTETIVHAYEEWGEDCPKHLRGMFAFAIYDTKARRLFLARDRVGKKPLVYTTHRGQFLFGSEFQSLLANPEVPRRPNLPAIDFYLASYAVPAPHTGYEGIYKLPPGHCLTIDLNRDTSKIEPRRYWSLEEHFQPEAKLQISEEDAVAELLQRLEEAVKIRLISEVPLGAFLSGGIDSSAVVAIMSRLMNEPVKTFSIGFEESEFSEIHHARRLAEHYGADHTEIIVKPDAVEIIPKLVRHYGEPYSDSSAVPTYYVSQATRQHVTVALNGDGGDELFAGYERYYAMSVAENAPQALLRLGAHAARFLPGRNKLGTMQSRVYRMLRAAYLPRGKRYQEWFSPFGQAAKHRLYSAAFKDSVNFPRQVHPVEEWFARTSNLNPVDACLLTDTNTYLPDDLLAKVDITSMANSLEARSPFLDHELMEWAAKLPAHYKLNGKTSKYILRKALEKLVPSENMDRRKMGFAVPVGHWFRNDPRMRSLLCDTVLSKRALGRGYFKPEALRRIVNEHLQGTLDHTPRVWSLLMLELWHQEFIDK